MVYSITSRTKELGIRMALGARRELILGTVLREAAVVVVGGLIAGLILTLAITPLLKTRLFGLAPHDPTTTIIAALVIAAASLVASYVPARRASKIDPMVALRHE